MKAYIMTKKEIDLVISGITLLSVEEYLQCRNIVPITHCWWWLRSPGLSSSYVADVSIDGSVSYYGYSVYIGYGAVRPGLVFNSKSSNLQIGDKIELANYTWTVINNDMMLCDESIGNTCFRKDWRAYDANDYEKSDIKVWLENWLENKIREE